MRCSTIQLLHFNKKITESVTVRSINEWPCLECLGKEMLSHKVNMIQDFEK